MVDAELLKLLKKIDLLHPRIGFTSYSGANQEAATADLPNGFHLYITIRNRNGYDVSLADDRYQGIYAGTFNFSVYGDIFSTMLFHRARAQAKWNWQARV